MDRVADYSNLLCDFLSHFVFGIQTDNAFAGLADVGEKQFQQIAFALTGVSED